MAIFAVIGFFARQLDFSFVTFLIGFVTGSAFELTLYQAIAITEHKPVLLLDPTYPPTYEISTLTSVADVIDN